LYANHRGSLIKHHRLAGDEAVMPDVASPASTGARPFPTSQVATWAFIVPGSDSSRYRSTNDRRFGGRRRLQVLDHSSENAGTHFPPSFATPEMARKFTVDFNSPPVTGVPTVKSGFERCRFVWTCHEQRAVAIGEHAQISVLPEFKAVSARPMMKIAADHLKFLGTLADRNDNWTEV
jgi:hypothetical protein